MSFLKALNITKVFSGTVALDDVSAEFESGRVNALVGKNGSGKSTLIKIMNGAHSATSGKIFIEEQEMHFASPRDAFDKGIATVYQELSLVPGMTVAENILIGRFPMKGKLVDWKKTYAVTGQLLEEMGIDISPKEMVYHLSMWQCQMIEIAKAMSCHPKVLLLDEPTSALAQHEIRMLFRLIRELKKKDVIIIYITHRLQELWEIADTCTVLRDGKKTGKLEMKEATHKQLLGLMFGDVEIKYRPASLKYTDEIMLKVEHLSRHPYFNDISFELRKGEILGIAGMLGSGRTELLRAIFGADRFDDGTVTVLDETVLKINPLQMKKKGLALTPEDRKNEGLVQLMSIKDNLCNASLQLISKGAFLDKKKETLFAQRQVENLQIKVADIKQQVTSLSGGNQQKVVVGNWLNTSPRIMFFDEPSRGIDVSAKQQIFQIIWDLSSKGVSSVVVSSELEELLEVCHRIIIMRNGRFAGEVTPEELKVEDLYALCMGGNV